MGWINNLKDVVRRKRSRDFAQELSNQFFLSQLCSNYENMFAQVRPIVDEMKIVMPYGVTERGTKLKEDKTPELAWLRNPNDEMGWAEFADLMFVTWFTEEELDIHVWRDKRGRVEGYTILPPESRIYFGYGRWEWQVMTTRGLEVLTEDDVMRLRFSRSPRNAQIGVSPASSVRIWAQIDDLIAQYQRAYFENGAVPATITFITASTHEKYMETRKELERGLKGARNRNKTIYAWRQFDNDTGQSVDQVEVKTIQGNNSTLAIKEIVDIVNDRLNKSIGVSNFILGDDSSAKYDNAELSDHQFTRRRVYPALISFWNQFQHELERILGGGLGYAITFDLEIPELTERTKAKAEIARIRSEALVNLISAGASGAAAVRALGLPDNWQMAADGIYAKGLAGNLLSPVSIDYEAPKPAESTVDSLEGESKPTLPLGEHSCTCHHSIDELPPMNERELKLYNVMVELAKSIMDQADPTKSVDVEHVIERMVEILKDDALAGEKEGAEALALLAKEDVASEILNTVSNGDVYVSDALTERIRTRANQLAQGFADHAQGIVEQTLATEEPLSASEIRGRLMSVMPLKRAELIARNETLYAIRSGRLEQDEKLADKYGLQVKLVWRTSGDSRVCPVCAGMAGQTVYLGQPFDDTFIAGDRLTKKQLEQYKLKADDVMKWEHSSWNDNGRICSGHVSCRCYWDEELV
jgi:phage portal protein BeeE